MTLTELRKAHNGLFYKQDWFDGHAFMRINPRTGYDRLPSGINPGFTPSTQTPGLPSAVELAELYVHNPAAPIWQKYLWTSDSDDYGRQIYVGGVSPTRGNGLEIHRHLTITSSWVTPVW